jgi:hypothetical protein
MKLLHRRGWITAWAVVVATSLGVGSVRADPLVIPEGFDLFLTVPGDPSTNTGTFTDLALPAGFFGTTSAGQPSDAFQARVFLKGNSVDPGVTGTNFRVVDILRHFHPIHGHWVIAADNPPVDSWVFRGGTVLQNIGDTATVPIKLSGLSLASIQSLDVTYAQGQVHQFFDMAVGLPPGVGQRQGLMDLFRTDDTGGTFASTLPVTFQLTFTNTDPNGPRAQGQPIGDIELHSEGTGFVVQSGGGANPEPATLTLLALGTLGLLGYAWRRRLAAA